MGRSAPSRSGSSGLLSSTGCRRTPTGHSRRQTTRPLLHALAAGSVGSQAAPAERQRSPEQIEEPGRGWRLKTSFVVPVQRDDGVWRWGAHGWRAVRPDLQVHIGNGPILCTVTGTVWRYAVWGMS